jgi:hypothetical protein
MVTPKKPALRKLGVQFDPFVLLHENNSKIQITELYHGSPHELSEGDVIVPKTKKVAHATTSWANAYAFSHRTDEEGNKTPGNVYVVHPIDTKDTNSTWVRPMKYASKNAQEVVSSKGFRVLKKAFPE